MLKISRMLIILALGFTFEARANAAQSDSQGEKLEGEVETSEFLTIPPKSLAAPKAFGQGVWDKLYETYTQAGKDDYKRGRMTDAESMFRGAVKQAEKLGPGDRRLGVALTNLGAVLRDEGKYDESESVFKKAIAVKSRYLAVNDPSLADTMKHYANLLRKEGRAEDAELWQERADTILANLRAQREHIAIAAQTPQNGIEFDAPKLNETVAANQPPGNKNAHRITNIVQGQQGQPGGSGEPITIIRINALVLGGMFGGSDGSFKAYVSQPEIFSGMLGGNQAPEPPPEDPEVLELASKYGIETSRIDSLLSSGKQLVEVDGNKLYTVEKPLAGDQWHVGTAVSINQPGYMANPNFIMSSEETRNSVAVEQMAAL